VTAVAVGPYEHTGPYAETEFFDTTGTLPGFCPECEHAPCVAGRKRVCTLSPRYIVARQLRNEVLDLLDRVDNTGTGPWLGGVLRAAVYGLADAAGGPGGWSAGAIADLAQVRSELRKLVR
jgi:hypothetical protein